MSSQPKKGVSGFFGIKVNLTIHYSLFKHGSTIHGYYSRFLFCLFKEARSSFVSRFNLGSYALPSLFFFSHHVTSSSFPTFVHCKIFLLMYNISMF